MLIFLKGFRHIYIVGHLQHAKIEESEIMAYLEIPTLSLTLPVFYGTKEDNLTRGVGHLNGTSIPSKDKTNHSVICGHTGYSKARLFTDLVELKKAICFISQSIRKSSRIQLMKSP